MPSTVAPSRALRTKAANILFAVIALAGLLAPLAASAEPRFRRQCHRLCQPFRQLCVARNGHGRQQLYRLCWKNLIQSCQLSSTQVFPPRPSCLFPCGRAGDPPCSFGRTCVQGQCIIPPLFGTREQCPNPDFPKECPNNVCCPVDNTCRADDRCCPAGFPVDCSPHDVCCPEGNSCRSDGRCCPEGYPVECPNVCCPGGTQCGPGDTCSVGRGGGGGCTCYCPGGSVCTSNADCGVDQYGIPNVCGCPVSCLVH